MWKKLILLTAALCLFVASNLTLCCRAELDGTVLEGFYSPRTLRCAEEAARIASEEICRGEALLPELRRHYTLRLHPALGKAAAVSDALLLSSPEIISGVNVYVKGVKLGRIESAPALNERLERFILGQKPNWAVSGTIPDPVLIKQEYTRAGALTTLDDMALLVSGMSPVMYFDNEGRVGRA